MTSFGFSALNKNFNLNKENGFHTQKILSLENNLVPVRVLDIILDASHPRFKSLGGWRSLGAIQYELVNQPLKQKFDPSNPNNPVAYPSYSNIKNYPLINELVYIISLPNTNIGENNNSLNSYYLNLIALWNHPHHNAYPSYLQPISKNYNQTSIEPIQVNSENERVFLGKTFNEKPNIHPLLPFEGDIIYEGRFGNSIRLGSTVNNGKNNWSSNKENGNPIIIIRNGQGSQNEEGWEPIVENINNDDSSIYLCNNQVIPISVSSQNYTSYETDIPISPSKYNKNQIILDSGRLLFNSYDDSILFSSNKSISLNSQQSLNIDTKETIINSDKTYLGIKKLATEPLMLGNVTSQVIRDLTSALKEITNLLQNMESDPAVEGNPVSFSKLLIPTSKILSVVESLEKQIGTNNEDCTLISKRNFTL